MVSPEVFAIAMVIDSSIVLEKEKFYVTVELKGEYSRGLMVVDRRNHLGKSANVFVLKNLDLGKTQALFGALFASRTTASAIGGTVPSQQAPGTIVCLAGANDSRENLPVLFKEAKVTIL